MQSINWLIALIEYSGYDFRLFSAIILDCLETLEKVKQNLWAELLTKVS